MIEITLTTIAAYGSFIAGEQLHGSGVIAAVVAGMLCGNYGARIGMTPSTRVAVETFWEYVAFALNSLIFLLIGFESSIKDLIAARRRSRRGATSCRWKRSGCSKCDSRGCWAGKPATA